MRSPLTVAALLFAFSALPAVAAIHGVVMTTEGLPVSGARVALHAPESPEARRTRLVSATPQRPPLATVETDARGSFSIQSPKEPVVELRIDARGYEPSSRRVERDEEAGAIALTRREMKKGSVTAGGKAVAGATVVIAYNGADYTVSTDAEGRYEAPDVRRARSITVIHRDYAIDTETFSSPATATSELNRTLTAGKPLTGRAVAANGTNPVEKAVITIDSWPVATSGEDGTFAIAHVPAKWTALGASRDSLAAQRSFTTDKSVTLRLEKMATVAGRVTDSKTKVPVAGVIVNAFTRRAMADAERFALTDTKGGYTLNLPAGSFNLVATHPGFEAQNGDVSVTLGQQLQRDLTVTPLARVSGVVIDEEKRPVAAALITPETELRMGMGMPPMRMMRGGRAANTISGPDGRFSLRIATDSELRIRAVKKGLPPARGDALRLGPGEQKTGVVLTIPTGIAVSGVVKDPNGDPLSGVAVVATETPAGTADGMQMRRMIMRGGPQGEEEDSVRTSSDGTFTLRVKEGTYDFAFRREGFAPKEVRAQNVPASGGVTIETSLDAAVEITGRLTRGGVGVADVMVNSMGDASSVTTGADGSFTLGGLSPGPVRVLLFKDADMIQEQRTLTAPSRDVAIDLPAGGTIRGRVVEKGSRKPIPSFDAGVSTSGSSAGMVRMGPPMLRNFSNEDGSFTLEHVTPGATNLVANAPGYASGRMNVDVHEGKTVSDIILELETGARLVGKITSANGSPLSDATVAVAPSPTGSFGRSGAMRRTATDARGEFTLDSMDSGEETIHISHPKHVIATRTVTLKSGETRLDVQLESGQRVTGIVVNETGTPVAEAEVSASSGAGQGKSARTDATGAFELESMSPGRYRFTAAKSGYTQAVVQDVDVSSGAPVRLVLGAGGTIFGRITGLAEKDYAHTTVNAFARGNASAAVDPSGNFRIEGAPTGTVSVSATVASPSSFSDRRTSATQTVQLEPGSSQQVTLEFRGDTVVRGRVTRNGSPLSGAMVSFNARSRAQASASVSADQEGRYSAAGLEQGEYSVTVNDSQRFGMYTTTYTVRGSSTFDIDYKAGTVRGRVLDASTNEPIADASVQLLPTERESRALRGAVTDASGAFIVDLVPSGAYAVTASREGYGNQVLDVAIGESGRDGLELKLARNDGVTMSVVDGRDGRALAGVVTVYDVQGRSIYESRSMFSSLAGDLRIPISPGSYTASVSAPGYASRSVSFTAPSRQTVPLTPGGRILVQSKHSTRRRMRLLDASGSPYPRYGQRPAIFDLPPGSAPIANVAAGAYTLQLLNDDESVAASERVVVREGETVTVQL